MSEPRSNGCLFTGLIFVVIFTLAALWSSSIAFQAEELETLLTSTPMLVLTVPPLNADAQFQVENNQVIYGYRDNFDGQYIIAGQILDSNREPILEDIRVNIEIVTTELPGLQPPTQTYSYPGDALSYGASGWAVSLDDWWVDYLVWLTSISSGQILSPQVLITGLTSDHNEAIINFIEQ
jgi:hypothetical protein